MTSSWLPIYPSFFLATKVAGYLAAYWNMPMFSYASTDPVFSDKDVFTTLVRTSPPFTKMGAAIIEVSTCYRLKYIPKFMHISHALFSFVAVLESFLLAIVADGYCHSFMHPYGQTSRSWLLSISHTGHNGMLLGKRLRVPWKFEIGINILIF